MARRRGVRSGRGSIYQKFQRPKYILRGMEVKCVAHILRESLQCRFNGLDIQYLSGEDRFSGWESPRVDILNSNAGGAVGGRGQFAPPTHTSHGNTLHSWRIPASGQGFILLIVSYTMVGLFISFSGRLGVFGGV